MNWIALPLSLFILYLIWQNESLKRQTRALTDRLLVKYQVAPLEEVSVIGADKPKPIEIEQPETVWDEAIRGSAIKQLLIERYPELASFHYDDLRQQYAGLWKQATELYEREQRPLTY